MAPRIIAPPPVETSDFFERHIDFSEDVDIVVEHGPELGTLRNRFVSEVRELASQFAVNISDAHEQTLGGLQSENAELRRQLQELNSRMVVCIDINNAADTAGAAGVPALNLAKEKDGVLERHVGPCNNGAASATLTSSTHHSGADESFTEVEHPKEYTSSGSDPRREEFGNSTTSRRFTYMFSNRSSQRSSQTDLSDGGHITLKAVVKSMAFETFIGGFILVNCVTMGMQADDAVTNKLSPDSKQFLFVMEHIFTVVFLIELILRLKVMGWRRFLPRGMDGKANFVDMCLVIFTGVLFTWVMPLLDMFFDLTDSGGFLKMLTLLRTIRLARLVRVLHRMPIFREAWMLIRGLSDSIRTLFWTCVVIVLVTYIFAVFGLELMVTDLLGQQQTETDPKLLQKLDDLLHILAGLDRMMYTLIQTLFMDSIHAITRELLIFVPWSWVYFYAYMAVAVIVLMNLVTAIIVENAMATSANDHDHAIAEKEHKRHRDMRELHKLFKRMDSDGGGTLSWDEFKESFDDPDMSRMWTLLDFQPDECAELFQLLDDGDGDIATYEFMEGLSRMKGNAQSKDVFRVQKSLIKLQNTIDGMSTLEPRSPSPKSSKPPTPAF